MACLPRASPYAPNQRGVRRTLDEACQIAREASIEWDAGVIEFAVLPPQAPPLPANIDARYFDLDSVTVEMEFQWEADFVDLKSDKVRVRVAPHVFDSDEHIIAIFAHETFELEKLCEEFRVKGGLNGKRLYSLLNEVNGDFHCLAWDHSDHVLGEWRGRK